MSRFRKIVISLIIGTVFTVLSLFVFVYVPEARTSAARLISQIDFRRFSSSENNADESFPLRLLPSPTFVSNTNTLGEANLRFNLPAEFRAPVNFEEDITAPNLIYSVEGGNGITVSGDPQRPVVSNDGVLSVEGLNGNIELIPGNNIQIQSSENGISISALVQRLGESDIESFIFDGDNTGVMSSGGLNLPTLTYFGSFPSQVLSGAYTGVTQVGTLNGLAVSGLTLLQSAVFTKETQPSGAVGQVYFDKNDENLYVYTSLYGWVSLTSGGILFTTDGQGIELVGNEFQLELDGETLSKSAAGLKISETYAGQSSITTVGNLTSGTLNFNSLNTSGAVPSSAIIGNYPSLTGVGTITSGTWQGSEIADSYISDALTVSNLGSVADGALSVNVSLLGQSIDSLEIENSTILPEDLNKVGSAPQNSNLLSYDGTSQTFRWTSLETLGGVNYWSKNNNVLSPIATDDVLSITSGSGTPLTLINSGTGASLIVMDENNDTTPFIIDKNGNVGIGNTNPQFKLDVSSKIGINSTQVVFLPSQATFSSTLILGNGGESLSSQNNGIDGTLNTLVGMGSGVSLTTGYSNSLIGANAGNTLRTGRDNVYTGTYAGFQATTALFNVSVGAGADQNNQSGSNNVMIGYQAGFGGNIVHSKSGSVMIGFQAGYSERNSDRLYIDNSATSQPLIFGNFQTDVLTVHGSLGIGTTNPGSKLTIPNLSTGVGTAVVIDASGNFLKDSSSLRYKTNISPLNANFRKILELKPVSYTFKATNINTVGYIAEEINNLGLSDLVVYDNNGLPEGVRYDRVPLYLLELAKDQDYKITTIEQTISDMAVPDESNAPIMSTDEILAKLDVIAVEQMNFTPQVASLSAQIDTLNQEIDKLKASSFEASSSALLDVSQVQLDALTVLGESNIYDLNVTGIFNAGIINIDGVEGTVNTLGAPLKLQSEKMADVLIMGEEVRVTTQGDVQVKGEVQAEKIIIIQEDVKSASAGESAVPSGADRIKIETTSVQDSSMIYVTFTSNYNPATRFWIEERISGESFVLRLNREVEESSKFSWWIVNSKQ
jgi:hypothetical protein